LGPALSIFDVVASEFSKKPADLFTDWFGGSRVKQSCRLDRESSDEHLTHVDHSPSTPKSPRRIGSLKSLAQTCLATSSGNPLGDERHRWGRATCTQQKDDRYEGRVIKDAVRTTPQERRKVLRDLVDAICEYRNLAESTVNTARLRLWSGGSRTKQAD
jgi:hypothetical protein